MIPTASSAVAFVWRCPICFLGDDSEGPSLLLLSTLFWVIVASFIISFLGNRLVYLFDQHDESPPETTCPAFPWKAVASATTISSSNSSNPGLVESSTLVNVPSFRSTYVAPLCVAGSERRRKVKWDKERLIVRALQQQLATLRAIRAAKRTRLLSQEDSDPENSSTDGSHDGDDRSRKQCSKQQRKVHVIVPPDENGNLAALSTSFPWRKSSADSNRQPIVNKTRNSMSSVAPSNKKHSANSSFGWPSLFGSERRRKEKWDKEMRRWRVLQQQLADLRSIRYQREAAGTTKIRRHCLITKAEGERLPAFPWKQ